MTERRKMPARRRSWTQRVVIGGTTCYLTCGEYDDGSLGEVFINVSRAGSALRAVMDSFARSFSVSLQHGTPLRTAIRTHLGTHFKPDGAVLHDDSGSVVDNCKSIIDWVMQEIYNAYVKTGTSKETAHDDRELVGPGDQYDGVPPDTAVSPD